MRATLKFEGRTREGTLFERLLDERLSSSEELRRRPLLKLSQTRQRYTGERERRGAAGALTPSREALPIGELRESLRWTCTEPRVFTLPPPPSRRG